MHEFFYPSLIKFKLCGKNKFAKDFERKNESFDAILNRMLW